MVYIKTTWAADTEITSSLLNHLETQYDEAAYDVDHHDHDDYYYSKTEMNSGFWHAGNDGSGSGCDADTLGGHEAAYFAGVGAPSGLIVMYDGEETPSGWYDCDGSNGTPNLEDRFVVGAGDTYAVGGTGGSASVVPEATLTIAAHAITTAELPVHSHGWSDKYNNQQGYMSDNDPQSAPNSDALFNSGYAGGGQGHGHAGSTFTGTAQENRPPFYALKYIMKE